MHFQNHKTYFRFKTESERLDVLINNAGMYGGPLRFTENGLEMHFGVNYVGHFLLTNLLLDYIKVDFKVFVAFSNLSIFHIILEF